MSENKERGIDSVVSFGGEHFVHWHTYNNIVKERDTLKAKLERFKNGNSYLLGVDDGAKHINFALEVEAVSLRKEVERYLNALQHIANHDGRPCSICLQGGGSRPSAEIAKEALSGREGRG